MKDIKSMTREELSAEFAAMGEPAFRAKQVFSWLHRGARFEEMTNLPKTLRERLAAEYALHIPEAARKQVSAKDGTVKYLWRLRDGHCVESVLMRYHHGNTVCISSEVGCAMGCAFSPSSTPACLYPISCSWASASPWTTTTTSAASSPLSTTRRA